MDLNDLNVFLIVAREGGLSAAARAIDESPATIGRRVTRLEEHFGRSLFHRSAKGYRLTDAGSELVTQAETYVDGLSKINAWRATLTARETVRVTAGAWTTMYLIQRLNDLEMPSSDIRLEFVRSEALLDIGHRHAEIGIRNTRPTEPWLVGRRMGEIEFAIYDHCKRAGAIDRPFIALTGVNTPSARWLNAMQQENPQLVQIALSVSDPRALLDAALIGSGKVILPVFIGDQQKQLRRDGDVIESLTHYQWLVSHHETRHRPGARAVANWIGTVMKDYQMRQLT